MPENTWSELLNKAEVEGGGSFSTVPEGTYNLVVVKSEARKTTNKKDMFVIQAKIVDGPEKGRMVFNNFVISPESPVSLRIFFQQMKTLGLTGENLFNSNPKPEQIAQAIYGKVFSGVVKIEKDNKNEDRNVIKNFSSPTEVARTNAAEVLASHGSQAPSTSATPSPSPSTAPPSPSAAAPTAVPPAPVPAPSPVVAPPAPAPVAAPVDNTIPPPPPAPVF